MPHPLAALPLTFATGTEDESSHKAVSLEKNIGRALKLFRLKGGNNFLVVASL